MIICPRCGKEFKEGTGELVIVNDKRAERSYPAELCPECIEKLILPYGTRPSHRWKGGLNGQRC